jgi:hypothetical protein
MVEMLANFEAKRETLAWRKEKNHIRFQLVTQPLPSFFSQESIVFTVHFFPFRYNFVVKLKLVVQGDHHREALQFNIVAPFPSEFNIS